MSYVTAQLVAMAEAEYGRPIVLNFAFEATRRELNRIKYSQKDGRAHDITILIRRNDQYLFIAKHFYPRALFRAPSGAARPGEQLADAAIREAYEETGVSIKPKAYILRTTGVFYCGDDRINWSSHVFSANYLSGEIAPLDTREIREARFVSMNEIKEFNQIMLKINTAGFRYREFLTRNIFEIISQTDCY